MYRKIKAKRAETYKDFSYQSELTQGLMSMFAWTGFDDPMYAQIVELTLNCIGSIAFTVRDNAQIIGTVSRNGNLNMCGLGTEATMMTLNGKSYDGTVNKDLTICYNNNLLQPTLQIDWTAYMLTEIDKSLNAVIRKSRLNPIPLAKNGKAADAIKAAMDATDSGLYKVILDEDITAAELNGQKNVDIINITDPVHMDKLQYLTKYRDDIIRQFWSRYGQPMRSTGKMAQQSIEEIEQNDDYSQIIPQIMLDQRQRFCDKTNEIFGTKLSVGFSHAFKHPENHAICSNLSNADDAVDNSEGEGGEENAD